MFGLSTYTSMADKETASQVKTVTGLPENTEAALTYVLGWVSGLVFLLVEKDNKKIRFHAMQSLITFGGLHLLMVVLSSLSYVSFFIIGPILSLLSTVVGLLFFVLWLILIVKAYQGEQYALPIVGDFVKKQLH